jgi:hypothetical protein
MLESAYETAAMPFTPRSKQQPPNVKKRLRAFFDRISVALTSKWTNEKRRSRWIRAYVVSAVCCVGGLTLFLFVMIGCPNDYSPLFGSRNDPTDVLQFCAMIGFSTFVVSAHGLVGHE